MQAQLFSSRQKLSTCVHAGNVTWSYLAPCLHDINVSIHVDIKGDDFQNERSVLPVKESLDIS